MSYSLYTPCNQCTKKGKCTDEANLRKGVEAIHNTRIGEGHEGSGYIMMMCTRQNDDLKPQA